jgi:hypothetical protein
VWGGGEVGVGRYEVGDDTCGGAGKLYDGCCCWDGCIAGVDVVVYGGLSTYVDELAAELGGGEGYVAWGLNIWGDVTAGGLKVVARWADGTRLCGAG